MTLISRLKTTTALIGRLAACTALGLGLFVAVAATPVQAFAQTVDTAPAAPALATVPQAEGDGPALWVIRDADSTVYLFGTVHVLRPTTAWGSAEVDAAFDSASELWMEIPDASDQAAVVPLIQQYGVSPDRPLSGLLTAEELAEMDAAARTAGMTAAQMETFRPWLAGLTLAVAPLMKAGYDPTSGVELILKARADAAGKSIKAFETADQQVRILAGLTEATQLEFLRATLDEFETATADLDALVEGWADGDVEAIDRLAVEDLEAQSEEVYEALLVNRNTDWANQIQTLMAGAGTAFIAVGAAHLAGDDSVQEILESRGVEVTRQ